MKQTDRELIAQAHNKAHEEAERQRKAEEFKKVKAKLQAETARDSRIPARMVRP